LYESYPMLSYFLPLQTQTEASAIEAAIKILFYLQVYLDFFIEENMENFSTFFIIGGSSINRSKISIFFLVFLESPWKS
jgi:hypothetical protein